MEIASNPVYYNPFDRRCWKAMAIGLPTLFVAIAALAMIGWWVWGQTASTAPATWLRHPWVPAGLAILGGFMFALAAGMAWTVGLIAHAMGQGALDAMTSHIRR